MTKEPLPKVKLAYAAIALHIQAIMGDTSNMKTHTLIPSLLKKTMHTMFSARKTKVESESESDKSESSDDDR